MADYTLSARGTYDGSNFDSGIEASKSKLDGFTDKAKAAGDRIKTALGQGFVNTADTITSSIGTISASIVGITATGGISRALNIENAQYKIKQMGMDVETVMASCNEAVKGTKFGLDSAATSASILGTSGVAAGDQMTQALKAAAGVATISGSSMEDVSSIFSKVATKGKLTGDELLQLNERGINATDALAKAMGKSSSEIQSMVSAGKIDFQTFSDAMYATFGDAAYGANDTFQGAMSNVMAALSRVGQKFASPALDALRQVFVAAMPAIDAVATALQPVADKFSEILTNITPKIIDAIGNIQSAVEGLGDGGFLNLSAGAKVAAAAIGLLTVGSIGGLIAQVPILGSAFGSLMPVLSGLATPVGSLVSLVQGASPVFSALGSAIGALSAPVLIVIAAIAALAASFAYMMATNDGFRESVMGTVSAIIGNLQPAITAIQAGVTAMVAAVMPLIQQVVAFIMGSVVPALAQVVASALELVAQITPIVAQIIATVMPAITQIVEAAVNLASTLLAVLVPMFETISSVVQTVWPFISQIVVAAFNAILGIVNAVMPVVQSVVTTVMNVISAVIQTVMAVIKGDWQGAWDGIKNIVSTVWNGIQSIVSSVFNAVLTIIRTVLTTISSVWTSVWNIVGSLVSNVWNSIKSWVSSAINAVASTIRSVTSGISSAWSSTWNSIKSFFTNIWSGIRNGASNGINAVYSTVTGIKSRITGFFSGAGSWLVNSGHSIMNGLRDGIQSAINGILSTVSNAVSRIRSYFPFSPAKKGAFSGRGWVKYSGISIMDALGEGAKSRLNATVSTYKGVVAKVADTLDVNAVVNQQDLGIDTTATSRYVIDYGVDTSKISIADETQGSDYTGELGSVIDLLQGILEKDTNAYISVDELSKALNARNKTAVMGGGMVYGI